MEIKTVTDYITVIEQLKQNYTYKTSAGIPILPERKNVHTPKFIYRGHSNREKYQLIPGIFRWEKLSNGHKVGKYSQLEYNIVTDFISESCRYIEDVPIDDIAAWLEIAQHFGVPTRLLDFTENPLVALYFACSESSEADASVWIINEAYYNEKYFNSPILFATHTKQLISGIVNWEILCQQRPAANQAQYSQYPVIYRPAYREERMSSQSSVFMMWGANRQPLTTFFEDIDYMVEDQPNNSEQGIICHIDILANDKKDLLKQLDSLGINEKFIYPGIEGVGRYIKEKYSSNQ